MIRPDKIRINLESYFCVGKEIEVDRYGLYRVDKLEDGVLYLSPALPRSYENSPQYEFMNSMLKDAVELVLEGK